MVRKLFVPSKYANEVTYNGINPKQYIVIHETANTSHGANADAHGRLQYNGNSRQASWHYTVDDREVVQSFGDNEQCWHAKSAYYNRNSIGIEICVNSDGNYKKAVANAVELVKSLMNKYDIPDSRVIQHNTASGKDCPHFMRSGKKGVTWNQFKTDLTKKGGATVADFYIKGDTGAGVKKLQQDLIKLGYTLTVDGSFGPATEKVVKQFQKDNKLTIDGSAGPKTLEKIKGLLKVSKPKKENNTPDPSHKKAWNKAVKKGVFDGTRPHEPITREQQATVLDRLGLLD